MIPNTACSEETDVATEDTGVAPAPKRARTVKKRPKKETYTIAYRVDGAALLWLKEQAASYGMSVHEYARQQLLDTIADAATEEMRGEIKEVRDTVKDLREDLAVTLEVVLSNTTKADPVRIRAWVDENLRKAR